MHVPLTVVLELLDDPVLLELVLLELELLELELLELLVELVLELLFVLVPVSAIA